MIIVIYILLYALAIIGIFLVASLVILRKKEKLHYRFAILSYLIGVWLAVQFSAQLLHDYSETGILLLRIASAVAVFVALFFLLFCVAYTGKEFNSKFVIPTVSVVAVFAMTPLGVSEANIDTTGIAINQAGIAYTASLVIAILLFLRGILYLFFYMRSDIDKIRRSRTKISLFGLGHAVVLIVFTLIVFAESLIAQIIIPMACLSMVSFMAYAIIKHKLFDIKLIVARSLGYVMSLGLVIAAFAFTSSLLSQILLNNRLNSWESLLINTLLFTAAVLTYPHIKRFFDRFTNHLFYRDAYEPQQFLNKLNNTVVENIELGILLRHTTRVIQDNIKSQFCFVKIEGVPGTKERLVGTGEFELSGRDSKILKQELARVGRQTIITDDLSSDFKNLKGLLSRNGIEVLIRLLPGGEMSGEAMYYLILGNKKSGNVYNEQDKRILEIIADEMLIAIQNSLRFEEIQGFAAKLQAEVNTATAKLQKTNQKLRELDETKDEFISMASHQLRTPLTSVKGYMSMVLEGDVGKISKQQRELLNQAFVSSQRMVYLIADLLNVSRLKTGKFIIEATPTNLAEVIEGEIEQLRETAKAKKIDIEYEKPKDFPTLALDETKIRQVIMNFADNAIYYTPHGGKVKVELSEDKSNIYFKVIDNGLGVPKADIPHLFTKFYRASNARKARPDGTGLGLFMAKKVIDSQGGNLLFESEENKGSMFGFCFQKKKHAVKRHGK